VRLAPACGTPGRRRERRRSSKARIVAAIAATSTGRSLLSSARATSVATNDVSKSPATKPGSRSTRSKKGSVVRIPTTRYSAIARRILEMAPSRVSAQATSFEMSGS
jgi:hypothetical protein